ncbi:MAG TPA: hypothetical protein PLY68_03250 [Myxococcota bacterium]|nr:hypothetical protein [Myxococcota bacterium]HNZ04161.1 hypothetical protein [Myxococcota bacterium]HOD08560.1 hypothetical protein [Myxococcota bacterium]HPB50130.1 hypothetical protein [Myxococcota bacterium]HQP95197.1 hypothetical protein [Myxococcota bacterium]
MKSFLSFINARIRLVFFFIWLYALVVLLQSGRYLAFLRPEFGWVLGGAVVMFLAVMMAELARRPGDSLRWYEFQRPLILLIPLLFLMNAQGASLDHYTFGKRFTGTGTMAVDVTPSAASGDRNDRGSQSDGDGRTARSSGSFNRSISSSINPAPEVRPEAVDTAQPATPEADVPVDEPEDAAVDSPSTDRDILLTELYEAPRLYEGKQVSVIGMTDTVEDVTHQFGDRARILFRFLVSCCAADARPIAMVFETGQPIKMQAQGVWVRVTGRFTLQSKDGKTIPVIRDATMSTIPKPANEYLY